MAEKITLALEPRELVGKKVNRLRREGKIPATVYGKGYESTAVQMNAREFNLVLRRAGRTNLIELTMPKGNVSVFVHALQRHPVTRNVIHVDFRVVDLRTEVTLDVPVVLVGESPLAKLNDGVVNQVLATVQVRALPADMPAHVEADVTALDSLDKNILVKDLTLPEGTAQSVEIVTGEDEVAVAITPANVDEEALQEEIAAEEAAEATTIPADQGGSVEISNEDDEKNPSSMGDITAGRNMDKDKPVPMDEA